MLPANTWQLSLGYRSKQILLKSALPLAPAGARAFLQGRGSAASGNFDELVWIRGRSLAYLFR